MAISTPASPNPKRAFFLLLLLLVQQLAIQAFFLCKIFLLLPLHEFMQQQASKGFDTKIPCLKKF
jgi:hypothetical protein